MSLLDTLREVSDSEYSGSAAFKDDDDADYRPVLKGIINTRCNYDGAKIEGSLEQ